MREFDILKLLPLRVKSSMVEIFLCSRVAIIGSEEFSSWNNVNNNHQGLLGC